MANPFQIGGAVLKRQNRSPNFPMAGTAVPYGLYPIMSHPVLPGETLQSFTAKLSSLSMPIKHPLAGCWLETWLVYTKFTDLDRNLGQMFVSDSYSTSGWTAAAKKERFFVENGQIDWLSKITTNFHSNYFVHDGETAQTIDGVPLCKLNNSSWYQNAMFEPTDAAVPTTDASDLYEHLQGWMMLQQMELTELTYEKYLEQYGVTGLNRAQGAPEILRFSRSWVKPTNVVNPANGTPASAWVWNDEIKATKPKRFIEPGFITMFVCYRPKLYVSGFDSSMIGTLWGFSDFFPAYSLADPTAGVKSISSQDTVFSVAGVTNKKILYDTRDLLAHGEQFVNTTQHPYRLPVSTGFSNADAATTEQLRGEYPTASDIEALFVTATDPSDRCYYEGIAQAVIAGHVGDSTPRP